MRSLVILTSVLLVCLREYDVIAYSLPGPRVFVVTPSPRPLQNYEGRSGPFYYHDWIRRMDKDISTQNATSTTTKTVPNVKTPDLIFAEFESDSNDNMKKSLRKLLEKEKTVLQTTTTTTFRPIYVPDEDSQEVTETVNYGLPINVKEKQTGENSSSNSINYYSMYSNWYKNMPSPVVLPSTPQVITTELTTTAPEIHKVADVWHIIDSEKNNYHSGNWEEVSIESNNNSPTLEYKVPIDNNKTVEPNDIHDEIDENFALPGFGSNPGNGAENESRAIRYEPNIRFPYVNLKPFQLKPRKNPSNNNMNNKNGNSLMTSLDNFHDLKNPVRGEAQDVVPVRNIIDRYNPAQPYLPPSDYGSKVSKQNSIPTPSKATAMLVPPPPPPISKQSGNDFPVLTSPYESFPPYAPPSYNSAPSLPSRPLPPKPPISEYSPPTVDTSDDSGSDVDSDSVSDDSPPLDVGLGYQPPIAPAQHFVPTSSPLSKPFSGYSYDKPPMPAQVPSMSSMEDKPDFHGYHYSKPESIPPQKDYMPPSYDHHETLPAHDHDSHGSDYPELIFQKHHGDMDDSKSNDDMNGMVPPPMEEKPADHGPQMDDHGFPSDFPGDFKYHHDFDDHDFYHHHHFHPTTTTTTTEMPRVNRYSYYYLGKKLYYLPLYFSVYFIVYVGALIIKAVLRHKIVYPNSWRPNTTTATFFSKRSVDAFLANENLHEVSGRVTHAIATAAEKYLSEKFKTQ